MLLSQSGKIVGMNYKMIKADVNLKKGILFLIFIFMIKQVFPQTMDFFLNVSAVTSNSAVISWKNMKESNSAIKDYAINLNGKRLELTSSKKAKEKNPFNFYQRESFYSQYSKKTTALKKGMKKNFFTFYSLDNLEPKTQYTVKICALNRFGKSILESQECVIVTKPKSQIFNVKDFGANSLIEVDKKILNDEQSRRAFIKANTKSIQNAIDACSKGGTVFIPDGFFVCGALHLKSYMTLQIEGILSASPFADDYDFGFLLYPYYEDKRYWGLLNAQNAENLSIIGSGTVNGNGWKYADKNGVKTDKLSTYFEEGDDEKHPFYKYVKGNRKTVYKDGILASSCALSYLDSIKKTPDTATDLELGFAYSSRSTTVILRNVKNLFIEGLTFVNPANHLINILDSSDITISSICEFSYDCNNGDGIGLICCQNAKIFNSFIDSGDDCIVFAAGVGKNAALYGQNGVSNVEIAGNYFHHGHGGVAFGSHTALGIEGVFIHDNVFNHTDTPFRIKSAPANGGFVRNILFEDNALVNIKNPFSMTTEYSDSGTVSKYGKAENPAVFYDIICRNCTVHKNSSYLVYIFADEQNPHKNIKFSGIEVSPKGNLRRYVKNCIDFEWEEK